MTALVLALLLVHAGPRPVVAHQAGGYPIHPHDLRCSNIPRDASHFAMACSGGTDIQVVCDQTATRAQCVQTSSVYGSIAYACDVQLGLESTWRCQEIGGDRTWEWTF
jgi:hypothetical protein